MANRLKAAERFYVFDFKYKFEPFSILLRLHIHGVSKVPTVTVTNCARDSIRRLKGAAVFV